MRMQVLIFACKKPTYEDTGEGWSENGKILRIKAGKWALVLKNQTRELANWADPSDKLLSRNHVFEMFEPEHRTNKNYNYS